MDYFSKSAFKSSSQYSLATRSKQMMHAVRAKAGTNLSLLPSHTFILIAFLTNYSMIAWILLGVCIIFVILYVTFREKELREEKAELSKEKGLLEALMENVPDAIYFKDRDSKFIRINQAKANSIGETDPSNVIGKSDFNYFSKEDATESFNDEQKIINSGVPLINKIEERKNKRGELNWYSATKVPIINKTTGQTIGTVGITRNITKQIQAERELENAKKKAEEADHLKSAFLANMSHEIRTPMNAILGFSDLIEDTDISEEERSTYIQYIKENGQTLLQLIDDIIDISKIEANEIKINKAEFNINELCDELYSYYKQENKKVNNNDVALKLSKDNPEDITLYSDRTRIKQILSNLLSNSIKFTNKGEIQFGYQAKEKGIQFYVKDTGIGIEEDKINRIFERFGHFNERMQKDITGTGLGLSIAKYLVDLLGGKIWLNSKPDEGSTFYVYIAE